MFQSQTDAVLGWVDKTGRHFLMDTWISGYTQPFLDTSQNIFNTSGRIADGITTLSFLRKRITNDPKDLSFTNDHCLFMMFPVKGGAFNSVNKKIRKHEEVPTISSERICIRSCGNGMAIVFYVCVLATEFQVYYIQKIFRWSIRRIHDHNWVAWFRVQRTSQIGRLGRELQLAITWFSTI